MRPSMAAKQYPFIDIAVHPAVRAHFASGSAVALLSTDLSRVLWANGAAAGLFSTGNIYDFIDAGLPAADVMTRQLQAAARQLSATGDTRSVSLRIASGFRSTVVVATLSLVEIHAGERAVLFAAPVSATAPAARDCAIRMISGFDDPDTHMAVLDGDGMVLAASEGFAALGLRADTAQALIAAAGRHPDRLVKRPITTVRGTLPAAIGRVSDDMNLLFAVETILGRMDPIEDEPAPALEAPSTMAPVESVSAEPEPVTPAADPAIAFLPEDHLDADIDALPGSDEDPVLLTAPPEAFEEPVAMLSPAADILEPIAEPSVHTPDEGADAATEAMAPLAEGDELPADLSSHSGSHIGFAPGDRLDVDIDALPGSDEDPVLLTCPPEAEEEPVATLVPAGEAHDPTTILPAAAVEDSADESGAAAFSGPDADSPVFPEAGTSETSAEQETEAAGDIAMQPVQAETPEQAAITEAPALEAEPVPAPAFHFEPGGRAVRFVWKIDADGHFSEVSNEFAATVGPHAGDVIGKSFASLAEAFQLDPEGIITGLLQRRDTWSGKTVLWPIEGTRLKVPVDLAALPTYSRARSFDGFRGFGIVRVSDVVDDPQAIGLGLVPATAPEPEAGTPDVIETPVDPVAIETPVDMEQDAGHVAAAEDLPTPVSVPESVDDAVEAPATADPFQGERPALQPAADPEPAVGENVIPLSSIRQPVRTPLTRGEEAAFREIARRLGERLEAAPVAKDTTSESAVEPGPADEKAPAEQLPDAPVADAAWTHAETDAEPDKTTNAEDGADTNHAVLETAEVADFALCGDQEHAGVDAVASETDAPLADADIADTPPLTEATRLFETDEAAPADLFEAGHEPLPDDHAALHADAGYEDGTVSPDGPSRGSGLDESLIDALPVALLVHNGDSLFHANREFLSLTGYASLAELEEEGGLDALFAAPEDDEDGLLDGTMQLIRPEGRLLAVTARLRSIRWHDGHALLLALAPAVDLDDSDTDEIIEDEAPRPAVASAPVASFDSAQVMALRTEVEELRSILETATDGVVILGPEGEIRSMNRSASALFNYDESETRGKPFAILFAHESQRAVMDYIAGLSGHGVASVLNDGREVIGREASGGFLPLFMTMGRLTASNGFCAVIRDITQWKRTEDELRTAKRAAETANAHKTEFLARVSHEIRTPLNAIIGFSDMMASEHFGAIGNPRYVEYASDIGRSGRHVLDIVNDLLDISKIEAGEMELEFSAVELNEAIAEAVSLVQPQANAQRVIIRTSLSGAVPRVVADQRSVKQIALNILSNAIRFTPSGGQIVVSCAYETSGSVILRIRDTGVGMTRGELEQAMKPFRQVTTGARKRGDGTGLGLPLTKAMVEANRAQFSITSAPNEGTLVEITFPSQRVLAD